MTARKSLAKPDRVALTHAARLSVAPMMDWKGAWINFI